MTRYRGHRTCQECGQIDAQQSIPLTEGRRVHVCDQCADHYREDHAR